MTYLDQSTNKIWVLMWPTRDQFTRDNDFQINWTFHPLPTQKWPQIDLFSLGESSPKRMTFTSITQNDIFGPKHQNNLGLDAINSTPKLPATMTPTDSKVTPNRPFLALQAFTKTNDVHTQKPKMTLLGQNTTTIWVLRCQVQNKFIRDQIDNYVMCFTSCRSSGRRLAGRDQNFPVFLSKI